MDATWGSYSTNNDKNKTTHKYIEIKLLMFIYSDIQFGPTLTYDWYHGSVLVQNDKYVFTTTALFYP